MSLGSFTIPSFLLFLILSGLLIGFIIWRNKEEMSFRKERIFDIVIVYLFVSIIVGRIIYIIDNFEDFSGVTWSVYPYYYEPGAERLWFRQMPWILLKFWGGGISFSGLMLGGSVYVTYILQRAGIITKWAKTVVQALFFSHLIQLVGFFLANSYFGRVTTLAIGIQYPNVDENFRVPIQLFEIVSLSFVFILLWMVKRIKKGQIIVGLYIFAFAWVEIIAIYLQDESSSMAQSIVQYAYLVLIAFGLISILGSSRFGKSSQKQQPVVESVGGERVNRTNYSYRDFASSYKSYQPGKGGTILDPIKRRIAKARMRVTGGKDPENETSREDTSNS